MYNFSVLIINLAEDMKLEMATTWAVVNGIQDSMLFKLDEKSSNEESELAGIRHDLHKICIKYETQFELLNNKTGQLITHS